MILACLRARHQALSDITAAAAQPIWQHLLAPSRPNIVDLRSSEGGAARLTPQGLAPVDTLLLGLQMTGHHHFRHQRQHVLLLLKDVHIPTSPCRWNDNLCLLVYVIAVQQQHLEQLLQCVAGAFQPSLSASAPLHHLAAADHAAEAAVGVAAAPPSRQQPTESHAGTTEGSGGDAAWQGAVWQPCQEQALLLHILASEIGAAPLAEEGLSPGASTAGAAAQLAVKGNASPWVVCLMQLVRKVLPLAVCSMHASSSSRQPWRWQQQQWQ